MTPTYEILAIRYATNANARSPDNFIGGDSHDTPMPLDYFVWLLRSESDVILVDTGFSAEMADKRRRQHLICPSVALERLGHNPETIQDVIITHLHYDHAGNHHLFPAARYHIQDREMRYATGRSMRHTPLRAPFEANDVAEMVHKLFADRVVFHDGNHFIKPGVSVHLIGGHTDGLQVVRVNTKRGHVVLASDASHFYANMHEARCFPIVYHVGDMLEGFDSLIALADGPDHVIPGHDPLVTSLYPAVSGFENIAYRLDLAPRKRSGL